MITPKLNPSAILSNRTKNSSLKIKKRVIRFNKDDKLLIKLCEDIYIANIYFLIKNPIVLIKLWKNVNFSFSIFRYIFLLKLRDFSKKSQEFIQISGKYY